MIDSKICPFCKKENNCMANIANTTCWCNDVKVPSDLIALVPSQYHHKSCICKECILFFKRDKKEFISEYIN